MIDDPEFQKDIALLFAGAGISLLTSIFMWLIPMVFRKATKLKTELRVIEKNHYQVKIKLRFTNKSKESKYIENIRVYFQNASKGLIQCENQIDEYKNWCISRETTGDESFSISVPPEAIKETTLCFESNEAIDYEQEYTLWFNGTSYQYSFDINSESWQKIHKKVRFD